MRSEEEIMDHVKTTQIFDATEHLGCTFCPLHNNCRDYSLICDLTHDKLFFAANLLCSLMRAESTAMKVILDCKTRSATTLRECAKTLYKDFLPTLNNYFNAFCKYECEQSTEYVRRAIILTLAESLEYWEQLDYFDLVFSQNIANTRDALTKQYQSEILKSETEKLAENKKD